jgi:hypothetical protein
MLGKHSFLAFVASNTRTYRLSVFWVAYDNILLSVIVSDGHFGAGGYLSILMQASIDLIGLLIVCHGLYRPQIVDR